MKYKAVITDIDGTAVDSPDKKEASARLAHAVNNLEELGVKVCAATGRAQSFAKVMLVSMGLSNPSIVSGGTKIIDPITEEDIWSCGLSETQVGQIKKSVSGMPYGFLWNDSTEEDYLNSGWRLDRLLSFTDPIYFFEICFVPSDEVESVVKNLSTIEGIAVTVVVAQKLNTNDIHVTNVMATKEHAIYELERIIGVDKSEMIGVGDRHNDLHIFNAVSYKVAMENAVAALKDAADQVIGNVKEDGLAIYFEELAKEIKDEV